MASTTTCSMIQPAAVRTPFRTRLCTRQPISLPSLAVRRTNLRTVARAEGKVNREYSEESGKTTDGKKKPLYSDELPPLPQKKMSKEQKAKLREEYLSLGGSANSPIPNYFLYIIIGISFLAVLSWLSGAV